MLKRNPWYSAEMRDGIFPAVTQSTRHIARYAYPFRHNL